MKATREPLQKYLRSYRKRPRASNLPAFRSIREELANQGSAEALNLMNVLAFFGQSIPLPMLTSGVRILEKEVPTHSYDPIARTTTLLNTLKVLAASGLIQQMTTENTTPVPDSDVLTDVTQPRPDTFTINIHRIVQTFFIDVLEEEKTISLWLERAVRIFCHFIDQLDGTLNPYVTAMRSPEDTLECYEMYESHGVKLLAHVDKFESRHQTLKDRDHFDACLRKIQARITRTSFVVAQRKADIDSKELDTGSYESAQVDDDAFLMDFSVIQDITSNPSYDSGYGSRKPNTLLGDKVLPIVPEVEDQLPGSRGLTLPPDYVYDKDDAESVDDAQTVFSDTESLAESPIWLKYESALAEELFDALPLDLESVLPNLDWYLRAFSLRIGHEGNEKLHKNLKYLIYRHRRGIIERLCLKYESMLDDRAGSEDDAITLGDKMKLLWSNDELTRHDDMEALPEDDEDEGRFSAEGSDDEMEADIDDLPDLGSYRKILGEAASYQWFLSAMTREAALETPGGHNVRQEIRDSLLRGMNLSPRFRRNQTPTVNVEFHLDWDFAAFYSEQRYSEAMGTVIKHAITLTGDGGSNQVQAMTCQDYVKQVWGDEGVQLLRMLEAAVEHSNGTDSSPMHGELSNGTMIDVVYSHGRFAVQASGIPYSVVEVGEELAWISTALSSCEGNEGITCRRPTAKYLARDTSRYAPSTTATADCISQLGLEAYSGCSKVDNDMFGRLPGSCWRKMFNNPVIVQGYPIARRQISEEIGLDVSFDIMAGLANTKHAVNFDGRTLVKGFSTILAVTKVVGSTIWWHLCLNQDRNYISYTDPQVPPAAGSGCMVDLSALSTSRHILGWCREVKMMAGSSEANYERIRASKLGKPNTSLVFDKASISGGSVVNVGISCSFGIKDKSKHIDYSDDFISTLREMSKRYFVFYDVGERHAWLVDGASTILHLLRTFIQDCQTDETLEGILIFDPDDFQEADKRKAGWVAAFDMLEKNKDLPLWPKATDVVNESSLKMGERQEETIKYQTAYYRLKDQIMRLCNILQQISAHIDDSKPDGLGTRIRTSPRRQLDGFEFFAIATNEGTLRPKVATLHESGEGWVDFTREIFAPYLFGRGFGQLLQPVGTPCDICKWNSLPKSDLLAATTNDLKRIMKIHGDDTAEPYLLAGNIFWHQPDQCFEPCTCLTAAPVKRDRVQLCLPDGFRNRRSRGFRSPQDLVNGGAVLFGHSWKLPLRWGPRSGSVPVEDPSTGLAQEAVKSGASLDDDDNDDIDQIGSEHSASSRSALTQPSVSSDSSRHRAQGSSMTSSSGSGLFLHPNRPFSN
ncbi:hypothetical protein BX600DRAFT_55123 [Xylariales sp. PMI_506]|nr:hypothetical protein BX600DRAFT_55123 [Xylariales sp. PMI_506]